MEKILSVYISEAGLLIELKTRLMLNHRGHVMLKTFEMWFDGELEEQNSAPEPTAEVFNWFIANLHATELM
jgi:hypothetical protein